MLSWHIRTPPQAWFVIVILHGLRSTLIEVLTHPPPFRIFPIFAAGHVQSRMPTLSRIGIIGILRCRARDRISRGHGLHPGVIVCEFWANCGLLFRCLRCTEGSDSLVVGFYLVFFCGLRVKGLVS